MNTTKLKSFAPKVRVQLMEAVSRKLDAVLMGKTADLLSAEAQVVSLSRQAKADRAGLVERVAYTWFNRLAALRFLDARGWHPFHFRVLTPATPEESQPELLKEMRRGALPEELRGGVDLAKLNDLLDGRLAPSVPGTDPQGEVYRHLILAVCHYYHQIMPFLFEAIDDETELLLPDDLLTATSVAQGFREAISDADCEAVEVLGWLYQFYISEKKDTVMARKSAVPTADIPAVTQLFTPHWIVRYLVENSLGRLWMLNRPQSKLREHMPYYIEGDAQTDFLKISQPEEIRLCDPAVGSAHMLTYAFDLLALIYEEEGYPRSEIPALILSHNLYGLEICPRAAALAAFALTMKARELDRRLFQRLGRQQLNPGKNIRVLKPEVLPPEPLRNLLRLVHQQSVATLAHDNDDPAHSELWAAYAKEYRKKHKQDPHPRLFERLKNAIRELEQESAFLEAMGSQPGGRRKAKFLEAFEDEAALRAWLLDEIRPDLLAMRQRLDELAHWDLFGSLIRPHPALMDLLRQRIGQLHSDDTVDRAERVPLERILDQLHVLEPHYHVVVANPPYMGSGAMPNDLKEWAQQIFPDSKADLFAMFMERNRDLVLPSGMFAMITMQSWMFLSSYESLREKLLQTCTLSSMAHLGPRGFDSIGGEVVSTTAFVFINQFLPDHPGAFFRLIDGQSEAEKESMYLAALPKN